MKAQEIIKKGRKNPRESTVNNLDNLITQYLNNNTNENSNVYPNKYIWKKLFKNGEPKYTWRINLKEPDEKLRDFLFKYLPMKKSYEVYTEIGKAPFKTPCKAAALINFYTLIEKYK